MLYREKSYDHPGREERLSVFFKKRGNARHIAQEISKAILPEWEKVKSECDILRADDLTRGMISSGKLDGTEVGYKTKKEEDQEINLQYLLAACAFECLVTMPQREGSSIAQRQESFVRSSICEELGFLFDGHDTNVVAEARLAMISCSTMYDPSELRWLSSVDMIEQGKSHAHCVLDAATIVARCYSASSSDIRMGGVSASSIYGMERLANKVLKKFELPTMAGNTFHEYMMPNYEKSVASLVKSIGAIEPDIEEGSKCFAVQIRLYRFYATYLRVLVLRRLVRDEEMGNRLIDELKKKDIDSEKFSEYGEHLALKTEGPDNQDKEITMEGWMLESVSAYKNYFSATKSFYEEHIG